jgi:hypothetical protein
VFRLAIWQIRERALVGDERFELAKQHSSQIRREARPHFPREVQRAAIVVPDDKRIEAGPPTRIATDDKLLL